MMPTQGRLDGSSESSNRPGPAVGNHWMSKSSGFERHGSDGGCRGGQRPYINDLIFKETPSEIHSDGLCVRSGLATVDQGRARTLVGSLSSVHGGDDEGRGA